MSADRMGCLIHAAVLCVKSSRRDAARRHPMRRQQPDFARPCYGLAQFAIHA
jgi:hypothetical protein